jgi:hypothetical protein
MRAAELRGHTVSKLGGVFARKIREVVPALVFFLILFHLIGFTKAALLDEFSLTALRIAATTVLALLVAKAILIVEMLPIARLFSDSRRVVHVLWKACLFAVVTLLFRFLEEFVPLILKHDGVVPAITAIYDEIRWPLFCVFALWTFGGLLLYCIAAELVRVVGAQDVRQIFFGARSTKRQS